MVIDSGADNTGTTAGLVAWAAAAGSTGATVMAAVGAVGAGLVAELGVGLRSPAKPASDSARVPFGRATTLL